MAKNPKGSYLLWLFLGLLFLIVCTIIFKYAVEGFAASQCTFIKLGDYNLSTDISVKTGVSSYGTKKGLIYIPSGSTTFDSLKYQKTSDLNYSYISLTKKDINDIDVFERIKSIMACQGVPEFSNTLGINSKAALILCLQSNTGTLSRTFFVKCFVPSVNSTTDDSNVIIGEIANNTSSAIYTNTVKPVALIQNSIGTPNILPLSITNYSATTTYAINDKILFNGKVYKMVEGAGGPGYAPDRANDKLWSLIDYSYSLSYTVCPAASRPQGFLYTDCCSGVSDTTRISTTNWTNLVLTNSTTCPASGTTTTTTTPTTTTTTTSTISPATKSLSCGSNPDDSTCPMPYCSLDSTKGACSGKELLRDSTTGKYLDPTCKVGNYSGYGGRLQTICTGSDTTTSTSTTDTNISNLDIYNLLKNRSQWYNWVEPTTSSSGESWPYSQDNSNWSNKNWSTGAKWQNEWNGDTSNLPTNSYSSNKDDLLKKNKLLEERMTRLESQLINGSSGSCYDCTEDVIDKAC